MAKEKIIKQILSSNPEISREEILERLERKKRKTDGLIADGTLLRMIAGELGVGTPREVSTPRVSVKDLVPGLNDVTIVGRVIAVFPPKTFGRDNGRRVVNLLVADRSGILRVALWDNNAGLVESGQVNVGQIIGISHGYVREAYDGKIELNVGGRGGVEIDPKDVDARNYPSVSKFVTKIGEIAQAKKKKVNVAGVVKELFPVSAFTRRDASVGKVMRFRLADETGETTVVAWNERAEELERTLKEGIRLHIVNAKVKKALVEGLEIHVNRRTYVETLKPAKEVSKIMDLKEGLKHVNVEGEVITKPTVRNVETSRGENVKLAVFEIKDETGSVWVSVWRKHADKVRGLEKGDKVSIRNAYVKNGFGQQLEISTRSITSIKILS
jgi:ssDNA-binding replication factor A large subunit